MKENSHQLDAFHESLDNNGLDDYRQVVNKRRCPKP